MILSLVLKIWLKTLLNLFFFKLDPKRRQHTMEIFGYDFMLDNNLKPWLIEVNTNPCLELSSNYLSILIPAMIENAFRISIDPLFPPPSGKLILESFFENKFELIFHQEVDGKRLNELVETNKSLLFDDEEISDKEEIFYDNEQCD